MPKRPARERAEYTAALERLSAAKASKDAGAFVEARATIMRLAASKCQQWARRTSADRPLLMLLLGGTLHGDRAVRVRLRRECADINKARSVGGGERLAARGCTLQRYDPHRTLLRKRQAVFCLEPGGDTPSRRSLTDSLVLGCVPVLFTAIQDNAYGWLWGRWKAAARVLVDRRQYVSGRVSLQTLLGSVPPPLLELMQATIEAHGRSWQVSREDDPGDEVHALLLGALQQVLGGGAPSALTSLHSSTPPPPPLAPRMPPVC